MRPVSSEVSGIGCSVVGIGFRPPCISSMIPSLYLHRGEYPYRQPVQGKEPGLMKSELDASSNSSPLSALPYFIAIGIRSAACTIKRPVCSEGGTGKD